MGAGVLTLLGDFLKTLLALWLGRLLAGDWGLAAGGAAALIGHCYPIYFHFRGGKGVSSGAAVALMIDWRVFLAAVAVFLLAALLSKRASVASMFEALATAGYDAILIPCFVISNFGQGGACAAVALKAKDVNLKSTGLSASVSTIVAGISEPAMTVCWFSAAFLTMTFCSARTSATISPIFPRRYIRKSSATWSFRLRAVCRRLPASPMRAVSSVSMFMFGADANWGRVLCAIGYSGADVDILKVDVSFRSAAGTVAVCRDGAGIPFSEAEAKKILLEKEITILVTLHDGPAEATAWGCDLTYDYVKINGDYRT